MSFANILSLVSGLAIFLYGMEVMGDGFKHLAGSSLQDVLEKLTSKPVVAFLAGIVVTALIQSSSATTSMLVSFVNAGIMQVSQTVYVILGSNVGTTITGHLMALDVGVIAPFLAFIGVCLIMFVKNDRANAIGEIMMGLGFVFIGMDMMSSGLYPLGNSPFFLDLLANMRNPIFGILVGFVLTAVVQSSSASLGIIQSVAKTGMVQIKDVMFFNLGQNIGTCTTALIASLSFNRDAKRVAIMNLSFNIFGAILFTILYTLFPFDALYEMLAPDNVVSQIAIMHTLVNLVTALVCFPIANLFVKLAYMIIPDQGSDKFLQPEITQASNIESNTAFNIFGINIEIQNMFDIVCKNIDQSLTALHEHYSVLDVVTVYEDKVDAINEGISKNLSLLMASNINMYESKQAGQLFNINIDLERMSDHALNLAQAGDELVKSDLVFSVQTYDELSDLSEIIKNSLSVINEIIESGDNQLISIINTNEHKINDLCAKYRSDEIERIKKETDAIESGVIFSEILVDIERIGDHIQNVAQALCDSYEE